MFQESMEDYVQVYIFLFTTIVVLFLYWKINSDHTDKARIILANVVCNL